jgi:hypothetical protein
LHPIEQDEPAEFPLVSVTDPNQRAWVEKYQRQGWELYKVDGRSLEFLRRTRFSGNVRILSVTLDDSGNVQEHERREHAERPSEAKPSILRRLASHKFAVLGGLADVGIGAFLGLALASPLGIVLLIAAIALGNRLDGATLDAKRRKAKQHREMDSRLGRVGGQTREPESEGDKLG